VLWSIVLNYLLFLGQLSCCWNLAPNTQLCVVIVAAAPPGVVIAPFTGILWGNVKYSLIGVIGTCIASLLIIPAVSLAFVGGNVASACQNL